MCSRWIITHDDFNVSKWNIDAWVRWVNFCQTNQYEYFTTIVLTVICAECDFIKWDIWTSRGSGGGSELTQRGTSDRIFLQLWRWQPPQRILLCLHKKTAPCLTATIKAITPKRRSIGTVDWTVQIGSTASTTIIETWLTFPRHYPAVDDGFRLCCCAAQKCINR